MASEYKISYIKRSDTKVTVLAKFYETTVNNVEVTESNIDLYPDYIVGDVVQEVSRSRSSPEIEYNFDAFTTDEQIHSYLYSEASQYGTPIN